MVRFVHTADWQLGMTRHFLSEEAQARYSAARVAAIGSIGRLAERERCEFVLVCGDVFESNQVAEETVGRALEAMRQAGVPFYLLPGNHDPLSAASVWDSPQFQNECPPNVVVLRDPGPHRVPGGCLIAAPWSGKRPEPGFTARLFDEAMGRGAAATHGPTILFAAHGGVDALSPDADAPGILRHEDLRRAGLGASVGYVALGDRHSATCVDEGRGRCPIWYAGSPEATNFDDVETGSGQVLVVDMRADGSGVVVTPHRVGTWRMRTLAEELNGKADVDRLGEALSELPDKENTVVRLALKGSLSVTERAELDDLLERHGRLFASLRLWQRHTELATLPSDGEFEGFSGFVGEAVQELTAQAKEGSEAAQQALGLLLRLSSGTGAGA